PKDVGRQLLINPQLALSVGQHVVNPPQMDRVTVLDKEVVVWLLTCLVLLINFDRSRRQRYRPKTRHGFGGVAFLNLLNVTPKIIERASHFGSVLVSVSMDIFNLHGSSFSKSHSG